LNHEVSGSRSRLAAGVLHEVSSTEAFGVNPIHVDPALIPRARQPIDRMLAFTAAHKAGEDAGALVPHIGAA